MRHFARTVAIYCTAAGLILLAGAPTGPGRGGLPPLWAGSIQADQAVQNPPTAEATPRRPPLPPRIQDLPSTRAQSRTTRDLPEAASPPQPRMTPNLAPPVPPTTAPNPAATLPARPAGAGPSESPPSASSAGPVDWVDVRVDAEGSLGEEAAKLPPTPWKVRAHLAYEEQILTPGDGRARPIYGIRAYQEAGADLSVGEKALQPKLRPDRRQLAFSYIDGEFTLFSPDGPLTRDELDLLDVVANSVILDQLLPQQSARPGQEWEVPDEVIASILGLESVLSNTTRCRITEITSTVVRVELAGNVRGRVMGATSRMEILARFQYPTNRPKISWLAMAIRDQRTAGFVDGPFQGLIRLQLTRQARPQPQHLNPEKAGTLVFPPAAEQTKLIYRNESAGYQLLYDRKWYLVAESPDLVVFRLVDRRGLLGQCNLARLNPVEQVKLTLPGFQENVRQNLGTHFGRFLEADELKSATGHRMFRVHAVGQADEVALHWIYYLLASPGGPSHAAVFTVEDSSLSGFGEADRQFMDGFHFLEPNPATASGATESPPLR